MRRQVSTLVPVAAFAAHFFYYIVTPRLHVGLHAFAAFAAWSILSQIFFKKTYGYKYVKEWGYFWFEKLDVGS